MIIFADKPNDKPNRQVTKGKHDQSHVQNDVCRLPFAVTVILNFSTN